MKTQDDQSFSKAIIPGKGQEAQPTAHPNNASDNLYNDASDVSHLAAIVESSDDAIISKSLDGIIKTWNKGSEKMFGFSREEAVGKHISIILPKDCMNEEKMIMHKIHNNMSMDHYETLRLKKDGTQFYVSISVSPLKDRSGKITGVSKIARDITARKAAEAEIMRANRELVFQIEEKGKRAAELIIANKELAYQDAEKGRRATELVIANEELAFQNKEKEKRAAELIVANKELAFHSQEKEERAAELIIANKELVLQNEKKEKRASELWIANKELGFQNKEKEKRAAELGLANIELVFQNEEKQKRADELSLANKELAFQNEEKQKRADELSIANKELAFQNKEKEKRAGELRIANIELVFENEEKEKRASELIVANKELAYQNEEKEKRAAELLIAGKELTYQNREKEKLAAELTLANIELAYQNSEKEKRAAELGMANLELALQNEDKIDRAAQLEAVNKELESFSYSVSHDLRAPLRAIHGYTLILKETLGDRNDQEINRLTTNIMTGAKKMGRLIDDLLTFSRLGRKELITITVPMNELVASICKDLKAEQPNRHIEINISPLSPAKGDTVTLKQVWVNLISNAIKYSSLMNKTIIEISSEIKGNEIIYSVKDNGVGFDMRYVNKLYGVFQRLHSDKEFEGTGVGLAIVQRIVLKHGGRVWAESKVNEGAAFFFTLNI